MISTDRLRMKIACGQYAFICNCLSKEQLATILHSFEGYSDADVSDFYDAICCQKKIALAAIPAGTDPAAAERDTIGHKVLEFVCTPEAQQKMDVASAALTAMLTMPDAPHLKVVKRTATLLIAVIGMLKAICAVRKAAPSDAKLICAAAEETRKLLAGGGLPSLLTSPLMLLFGSDQAKQLTTTVCESELVKKAELPAWWSQ